MSSPSKRASRLKRNTVSRFLPVIKRNFRTKTEKIPIETTTTTTVRVRPRQDTPKNIKGRGKLLESLAPPTSRLAHAIKGMKTKGKAKGFKQHLKKVTNIGQHFRLKRRGSTRRPDDKHTYYEIPRVTPNKAFEIGWRPRYPGPSNISKVDDEYVLADPIYDAILEHRTPKKSANVVHCHQPKRKKTPTYYPVYENVGRELFYDYVPQCAPPKVPARNGQRRRSGQQQQDSSYYVVMK